MGFKFLSLVAAVALLAACESDSTDMAGAEGGGAITTVGQGPGGPAQVAAVPVGPIPGSAEDLAVNVGDRVFFGFDAFDLQPDAQAQIERWAAWLRQYPQNTVTIEGHCDERGTREYNLALGERRSNSTFQYLLSLGIAENRVRTISYGKERPAVNGVGETVWSQNRRAVLTLN